VILAVLQLVGTIALGVCLGNALWWVALRALGQIGKGHE